MSSFFLALRVVFPMLIYMLLGWSVRKMGMVKKEGLKSLDSLNFRLLLPFSLLNNLFHADLSQGQDPAVYLFAFFGISGVCLAAYFFFGTCTETRADQATLTQGVFRSNYVLFGLAIAEAMGSVTGLTLVAALGALVVPWLNVVTVILFETNTGGKISVRKLFMGIVKNPLIQAGVLGLALNLLHVSVPEMVQTPFIKLAGAATPVALLTLGGTLSFDSILSHKKYLFMACLGRLAVTPAVMLSLAVLMGFRGDALIAFIGVFGTPTAVASAPMAQEMGGNGPLAGEIVAMTALFCIISIFLLVFTLSALRFI